MNENFITFRNQAIQYKFVSKRKIDDKSSVCRPKTRLGGKESFFKNVVVTIPRRLRQSF